MNLKGIIHEIDTLILDNINVRSLLPQKSFGLAERYYDEKTYYSGVFNGSNVENCMLDDRFALSWYHRNQSGGYGLVENNFGDLNDKVEEVNEVELIIFAQQQKTKVSFETLKDIFVSAIPSVLSKVVCESLQLFDCRIDLISHELDSRLVIERETNKPDVRVGLNNGLIAIRYRIFTTYRRGCIVICENC